MGKNTAFEASTTLEASGGGWASMTAPPLIAERPHNKVPASFVTRYGHYLSRSLLELTPVAIAVAVIASLVTGWLLRNEGHLTAESGTGYWLGIVGSSLMLTLVLYPLRKRLRFMRGWGRVANWFRLHMLFGIAGPVLIVFHSNFNLGSLNSRAALITMLVVAASGIVGRYLYAKVHMGLYGRHAELGDVGADLAALEEMIGIGLSDNPEIMSEIEAFTDFAKRSPNGILEGAYMAMVIGGRIRMARSRLDRAMHDVMRQEATRLGWSRRQRRHNERRARDHLALYLAVARKAAMLGLFERLLALWHILHVPLFALLVLTATIHIIAVHLY